MPFTVSAKIRQTEGGLGTLSSSPHGRFGRYAGGAWGIDRWTSRLEVFGMVGGWEVVIIRSVGD